MKLLALDSIAAAAADSKETVGIALALYDRQLNEEPKEKRVGMHVSRLSCFLKVEG